MEYIFGGNGLSANARFGKGHIFGNVGIQVMTDHQHI